MTIEALFANIILPEIEKDDAKVEFVSLEDGLLTVEIVDWEDHPFKEHAIKSFIQRMLKEHRISEVKKIKYI